VSTTSNIRSLVQFKAKRFEQGGDKWRLKKTVFVSLNRTPTKGRPRL
jgi:hypothetical protein